MKLNQQNSNFHQANYFMLKLGNYAILKHLTNNEKYEPYIDVDYLKI